MWHKYVYNATTKRMNKSLKNKSSAELELHSSKENGETKGDTFKAKWIDS